MSGVSARNNKRDEERAHHVDGDVGMVDRDDEAADTEMAEDDGNEADIEMVSASYASFERASCGTTRRHLDTL